MITKEELDIKLEEGEGLIVLSKGLAIGYNLDTSSFALLTRPDNNFEFGEFGGVDIEDHVAVSTYEAFNQSTGLDGDIEEALEFYNSLIFIGDLLLKHKKHKNTIKQAFINKDIRYSHLDEMYSDAIKWVNELQAQIDNAIKIIDDRIEYHKQRVNRDDWSIGFSDYHRTAIIELEGIKQAIKDELKGDDNNE